MPNMTRLRHMIKMARDMARRHNKLVDMLNAMEQIRPETINGKSHYDGEPCNLPESTKSNRPLSKSKRLVYTGELRVVPVEKMEWMEFDTMNGGKVATFGWIQYPVWILREEPITAWAPADGEWVVADARDDKEPFQWYHAEGLSNYPGLRPAVASDWIGEIGGMKCVVFRTENEVYINYNDRRKMVYHYAGDLISLAEEICRRFSIPIMPYALYQSYLVDGMFPFDSGKPDVPEPPKPEPKYREGQWVIVSAEKPRCICSCKYEGSEFHYKFHENGSTLVGCSESAILRPAKPIDFAKEFGGMKVWMEIHSGITYEYRLGGGYDGSNWALVEWQVERNEAAGISIVPPEVCQQEEE